MHKKTYSGYAQDLPSMRVNILLYISSFGKKKYKSLKSLMNTEDGVAQGKTSPCSNSPSRARLPLPFLELAMFHVKR